EIGGDQKPSVVDANGMFVDVVDIFLCFDIKENESAVGVANDQFKGFVRGPSLNRERNASKCGRERGRILSGERQGAGVRTTQLVIESDEGKVGVAHQIEAERRFGAIDATAVEIERHNTVIDDHLLEL